MIQVIFTAPDRVEVGLPGTPGTLVCVRGMGGEWCPTKYLREDDAWEVPDDAELSSEIQEAIREAEGR